MTIGRIVCGVEYEYDGDGHKSVSEVIPIAGEFQHNGLALDPKYTRLKDSDSHADAGQEGVRIELHGGRYPYDDRQGTKQKVFIEMLCDHDRTGLEGDLGDGRVPLDDDERRKHMARINSEKDDDEIDDPNEGGNDGEEDDDDADRSLQFVSYKEEGEGKEKRGVLRLEWRTKWACEGMADAGGDDDDDDKEDNNKHWGFFTWFIIV